MNHRVARHIAALIALMAVSAAGLLMTPSARAAELKVGAGFAYPTLAAAVRAAQAHDEIRLAPGIYENDFATINVPLTLVGDGGLAVLAATGPIPNGKAILVVNADLTVRHLEFRGAAVPDHNGAGIRMQSGHLVVEDSIFRGNETGILSHADPAMTISVRRAQFLDNGYGDGFSHGIYAQRISRLNVADSLFEGTRTGHDIKSRAALTEISGSILDDGVSGTTSYAIDAPNGGRVTISGNTLRQGAQTQNRVMVSYGAEGDLHPENSLLVTRNTFSNTFSGVSVGIHNHTDVVAVAQDNTFTGLSVALLGPGDTKGVEEPGAAGLLGLGLLGVGAALRFASRKSRTAPAGAR